MAEDYADFTDFSRWAPRSPLYWALRPQKALPRLLAAGVPVAIRVRRSEDPRLADRPALVWWTHDRTRHGARLLLTFQSSRHIALFDARWRVVAVALWRMLAKDPAMVFHEVPVDLGDGGGAELPEQVFVFARPRGGSNALLPNPYLLRERKRVPAALPWAAKTDTLYFRGAVTGSPDLDLNTRVALCRAAARLPRTDCRLSRMDEVAPAARAQLQREGLSSRRIAVPEMNRHRFLVDADGNTTSWDRYLLIGTFGAVPILFETAWEECWHGDLVDGENCIRADRATLGAILERLRADSVLARHLARQASVLAEGRLSPAGAQAMFEAAWRNRAK